MTLENREHNFFDNFLDPVCIISKDTLVYINPAYERLTGYSASELEGIRIDKMIDNMIRPEDKARVIEQYKRLINPESDEIREVTFQFVHKNGRMIPVANTHSREMKGANGERLWVSLIRDASEEQRVSALLDQSKRLFDANFLQSTVGMLHLSLDGLIYKANPRITGITGYTADELKNISFQKLFFADRLRNNPNFMMDLCSEKLVIKESELQIVRKDGTRCWNLVNVYPIKNKLGKPEIFIANLLEIEGLKRVERKLKLAMMEGEQKERNRIGMELHDGLVSTFLAAYLQFKQIEPSNPEESEALKNATSIIQQGIRDIRSISHMLVTPKFRQKPLKELLATRISQLFPKQNLDFGCELEGLEQLLPPIFFNEIYRICLEILTNAYKYAQAPQIRLLINRNPENNLTIHYHDNGVGFDPSLYRDSIGLENLHTRVHNLGGEIDIKSSPGSGTSIEILIPTE